MALGQFAQNAQDTACAVFLLNAVLLPVGGEFAEERHPTRKGVDVAHLEVNPTLLGYCQQVEYGVGRCTHSDIERHSVEEGCTRSNAARQNGVVAVLVVGQGVLHNELGGIAEKLHTIDVCGQNTAVARQREAEGLRQRVHGVGSKHARAGAAAGTGAVLNQLQLLVAHGGVATLNHGRYEVGVLAVHLAGFHRTAADENGRNIQSHGSHQHARRHFVAVGDAHHSVGLVGVDHILHRVGYDVA